MIESVNIALKKPLKDLKTDEVRLLVSQQFALEYSVPMAIEILEHQPAIVAEHYEGDILSACLRLNAEFWKCNPDLRQRLRDLLCNLATMNGSVNEKISRFLATEVENNLPSRP